MDTTFSDPRIPFEVGTWARANPYDITTVRITRELQKLKRLREERDAIDDQIEAVESNLKVHCEVADGKLRAKDAKSRTV